MNSLIVDCRDYVRGRLLSRLVSYAKKGYRIHLFNTDYFIITGNMATLIQRHKRIAAAGHTTRGPHTTKRGQTILRRTIRGMFKEHASTVHIHAHKPAVQGESYPTAKPRIYVKAAYYKQFISALNNK